MRNIYDIIAEQKTLVDINICSYELNYLTEEFEYLQEELGESVKNVFNKIIEFINKVIGKIKELISKVVNFFKGKSKEGDSIQKIDDEIKAAKKNVMDKKDGLKDGSDEHKDVAEKINKRKELERVKNKDEYEKRNKEAEEIQRSADEQKKIDDERKDNIKKQQEEHEAKKHQNAKDLNDALSQSNKKVKLIRYASLDARKKLAERFFSKMEYSVNRLLKDINNAKVNGSFLSEIYDLTFVGKGSRSSNPNAKLPERIKLELGETGEEAEYNVKDLTELILSYKDYDSIGSYVQGLGQQSIGLLENLKRRFEQLSKQGENKNAENNAKNVNVVINIINVFTNSICTSIVRAHQTYLQVAKMIQNN